MEQTGDIATTVEHVAAIADPTERARAATQLLAEHQSAVARLAQIRRRAIAELRDTGQSYAQVGNALGLTRGRIAQLRGPDASIETAFFGGRHITIATPLRKAPDGRPMVAQEDVETATVLAEHLTRVDLQTSMQRIPVEGAPDFNPDALVVICGPGTSAAVGELLERDPVLDFAQRASGEWTIIDRESRTEFRSDPPRGRDVAYLGRLRRADGRPLILIAGVHAIGSLGVAQFLTEADQLRDIHRSTEGAPFSAVIGCSFDSTTLNILETNLEAPPRTHLRTS